MRRFQLWLGWLWLLWLVTVSPAVYADAPGDCFGTIDYADELVATGFSETQTVPSDVGFEQVQVTFSLRNDTDAEFDGAVVTPNLSDLLQDLGGDLVAPAVFPEIDAGATVSPDEPLIVELPEGLAQDFVDDLSSGDVRIEVYAEERTQLRDGNVLYLWTEDDVQAYLLGLNPPDPFGDPPYSTTTTYSLQLYYPGSAPEELRTVGTDSLWLAPDTEADLEVLPEGFHYFKADSIEVIDEPNGGQFVNIDGHVSREESLFALYESASLCAAADVGICQEIGTTRMREVDNADVEDEVRDSNTEPVRFNSMFESDASASASGQIHSVCMKPFLSVRIRLGDKSELKVGAVAEVDLSANLRAEASASFDEELEVSQLCFPIANINLGAVSIPVSLDLSQHVFVRGEARAGTAMGLSQRAEFGFVVTCEATEGAITCDDETILEGGPFGGLTPPQLTHVAEAHAEVGTTFGMNLWLGGGVYPDCNTGFRAGIDAEFYGALDVMPLETPWYSQSFGGDIGASVSMDLLGFGLVEHEVSIVSFGEQDADVSPGEPPDPTSSARYVSGEDQRWAVAIERPDTSDFFLDHVDAGVDSLGNVFVSADNRLMKLDRYGELLWAHSVAGGTLRVLEAAAVMPDDRLVVAGRSANFTILEPDGRLRWSYDYQFTDDVTTQTGFTVHDVAPIPLATGGYDLVMVGEIGRNLITTDDGGVFRLDDNGNVLWVAAYEDDGVQEFHGVTVARNGDIIAVGTTSKHSLAGSRSSAWVVRIDARDGSVIWSRALPFEAVRGGLLHSVVEHPNGTIYAGGSASRTVRETGSALLVRISADGTEARTALLEHNARADAEQDFEVSPSVKVSETSIDTILGLDVVGNDIVFAAEVGLGVRTGWVGRVGPSLAPSWFVVLDGAGNDSMTSITATPDGLVAVGHSSSMVPTGTEVGDQHVTVMKMPFEGGMALHPDYSDVTLRYMVPGLRRTDAGAFSTAAGDLPLDAPVTMAPLRVEQVTNVAATRLLADPPAECAALLTETGHPTTTDPCPDPDRFPPIARIVLPTTAPHPVSVPVSIDVVVFDEGGLATSDILLDGTAATDGDQVPGLDVGLHEVTLTAVDSVGQSTTDAVRFEVYDDVPPTVRVLSPEARSYDTSDTDALEIVVEATDEHTSIAEQTLSLDGAPYAESTLLLADLTGGAHELVVEVVDEGGNTATASVSFDVINLATPDPDDEPTCGCSSTSRLPPWLFGTPLLWLLRRRNRQG